MSVSIIRPASGPLMDGDISCVMDLLISQGFGFFFRLCFVRESGSRRKSNGCPPFGFVRELSKS